MLAKRVIRLALAPGALPFALLVAVVALIWYTTGRPPLADLLEPTSPPAAESPASAITYRGAAGPDGQPITLEQAISSVRRFMGKPDLAIEGGRQTADIPGPGADIYYLETIGAAYGEDYLKVDARTGEVLEATLRSRLAAAGSRDDLNPREAEEVAARFAHQRFFGFDDLTLVDRSSRETDRTTLYSFKWSKLADESGAELPVSVSVALAAANGEVVWYLAQRDPVQIDVRPSVDPAEAVRAAASSLEARQSRWETEAPTVRLQVLYDERNRQHLVWSITFRARQPTARPTLRLLVDAHTGRLIAAPS